MRERERKGDGVRLYSVGRKMEKDRKREEVREKETGLNSGGFQFFFCVCVCLEERKRK